TSYAAGSTVQLTALPATGFAFTGWSGDASGLANPLSLTMDANHAVTAAFADTAAPSVTVLAPNGGEGLAIGASANLQWTAADNAGVTAVDLRLSRSGAAGPYDSLATGLENTGSYAWTVTGPATSAAVLKVLAHDAAGHPGADVSNAPFTITGTAAIEDLPPGALALGPIQPNPAHGTAWIDFELPQAMRARLSILDLEGREVAVLADGELAAGSHAMTWAGRRSGGPAPAGLYFVRLEAGGRRMVHRIVLTR